MSSKMEGTRAFILCLSVGFFLLCLVLGQTCERYWLLHDGTCFRKFANQVSYLEAKKQCNSAQARLLTNVTDGLEVSLLGRNAQSENTSYWCKTGSDGDMFAMPGLILERRKRSTSCCFIQNMQYEMGECDEFRGYICEKDPIPVVDICLQNTASSSNASDWESARRYCQCNGGDLYSFNDTSEEENFLQLARNKNQSVWIGLRREADSDDFMWSDGTSFTHLTWDGGRPNYHNSKLCVAYAAQNATWEATDCDSKLSFTCKPSGNPYDVSLDEEFTETDSYYSFGDDSTVGTDSYYSFSDDSTMETDTHNVFYDETTTEINSSSSSDGTEMTSDWYNVSYEESTMETDSFYNSYDDTTMETTLNNTSTANSSRTSENPVTNAPAENTTAEAGGYVSACSPAFEDCYVAGLVIGIVIFLTAIVVALAFKRLRKKKEKVAEVPVQLLHMQSYKEDIPAKLLAAKIKEVIA